MKAIQIKYLPATNTKPTRLKVWAEGCTPLIVTRQYDVEYPVEARDVAQQYAASLMWPYISGFGCLPNGDYVATLEE